MMSEIINFNIDNKIYLYVYEIINIEILCNKNNYGRIYILNQKDLFAEHLLNYISYSRGVIKNVINENILEKQVNSINKEVLDEYNIDYLIRYVD